MVQGLAVEESRRARPLHSCCGGGALPLSLLGVSRIPLLRGILAQELHAPSSQASLPTAVAVCSSWRTCTLEPSGTGSDTRKRSPRWPSATMPRCSPHRPPLAAQASAPLEGATGTPGSGDPSAEQLGGHGHLLAFGPHLPSSGTGVEGAWPTGHSTEASGLFHQ